MSPDVTSRQHRIVREFKSAARREGDVALLDGWHLLDEAAAASLDITMVAVAGSPPGEREAALLGRVAQRAEVVSVTTAVMAALSPARTPAGVVALVRPRRIVIDDLTAPAPALVVVAVDVQDPGNAGAIVRSADAGGATGVLLTGVSADPWGWKALRASMGSTFRLGVVSERNTLGALQQLQRAGLALIASVPRGGTAMHDVDLRRAHAVLLGGEGAGLDAASLALADDRVSIPMAGGVESLNVAVAAALLVYEAHRQRTQHALPGT